MMFDACVAGVELVEMPALPVLSLSTQACRNKRKYYQEQ
jgi:hypothetical protein